MTEPRADHRLTSEWWKEPVRPPALPLRALGWAFILALSGAAFVLGFRGFELALAAQDPSRLDLVYLTLQLFTMESGAVPDPPRELNLARFLAPAVAVYAAVGALLALFGRQFFRFRCRFQRDHVVVCGLGQKGGRIALGFRGLGYRVIAIERDETSEWVRSCRESGVWVMLGDAADEDLLRRVRVDRARYVIAVCRGDGVNAQVSEVARRLVAGRSGSVLTCVVHVRDLALYGLLREREIECADQDAFRLDFFNLYESAARELVGDLPAPAMGTRAEDPVRLVIVGLGPLSASFLVRAAKRWRLRPEGSTSRLLVTVVAPDASRRMRAIRAEHPALDRHCEVETLDVDLRAAEFVEGRFLAASVGRPRASAVYVLLDDDLEAVAAALSVYQRLRAAPVPVIVGLWAEAGLASLIGRDVGGALGGLKGLSLYAAACDLDRVRGGTHEVLARAVHEHYVEFRGAAVVPTVSSEELASWEDLSEERKDWNRAFADHIGPKLAEAGCEIAPLADWDAPLFCFEDEEVARLAEQEHERWCTEKRDRGWRRGTHRDADARTHPLLVPWAKLEPTERALNETLIRSLPRALADAGFAILRRGRAVRA